MGLNEEQKLFDIVFKDYGGIVHEDLLINSRPLFNRCRAKAIKYIESCRKHLIRELPVVYFDFIDNLTFNAKATRSKDGTYLIGINAGILFILYDLFNRMLSYPNIVKNIGKASMEIIGEPTLRNYYNDAEVMFSCGDIKYNEFYTPIPKDNIRKEYALLLFDIAIDFIIAHELTHIVNGHVDYISKNCGLNFYDEQVFQLRDDKNSLLLRQTLEMDADCLAVSIGMGNAIRRYLGLQEVSIQTRDFYIDLNDTVFNWSLSVLTTIRIMVELSIYRNVDSKLFTNPHPRLRQLMAIKTVYDYLEQKYPLQYKSLDKNLSEKITVSIERAYKEITGNEINKEEAINAIAQSNPYIIDVLQYWATIRHELYNYTYVKLV